jgi:ABC-type proline/glycine betaine transport system substrate-binding protein
MKRLVSFIVALGLAVAFTAPAFAAGGAQPLTKADCKKAGMKWDSQTNVCEKKGK